MNFKIAMFGLILLLFTSCNLFTDGKTNDNNLTNNVDTNLKHKESDPKINRDRKTSPKVECIFDQKLQNDDFIKKIPAIKIYEWDKKTHTATISLDNGDTLELFRGGCDHFSIGGTLRMPGKSKLDEKLWKEKVLWITELLEQELKPDSLNTAIINGDFFIQRYSPTFQALKFKSKFLNDMNYSVDIVEKNKNSFISVYMTMN